MFAGHRLHLSQIGLDKAAARHMTQPAADHLPVGGRHAEQALQQESVKIENDRTADPDPCRLDDDVRHMPSLSIVRARRAIRDVVSADPVRQSDLALGAFCHLLTVFSKILG